MQAAHRTIPAEFMFRALSDRTRQRLLHLLRGGETCVCDLVAVLDVPQPKVSRHLAYLRRAGLVLARRQGLWMHYRLAPPGTDLHQKLLDCIACCAQDDPQFDLDTQRLHRSRTPCASQSARC